MVLASRVALLVTVVFVLTFAWHYGGGRWRDRVSDRLLYGIPWGSLLVVAINVGFYLLIQGGLADWNDPLVFPFVSWSYFYPVGWLTSGIAHGSPGHLLSNMAATVVFAPIAEYAWGHYPPSDWGRKLGGGLGRLDVRRRGVLSRPWVRAVVVFPGVLLAGAVLTSLFSLGPGIGFSGVVFAIAGFALVSAPLAAVVGVVATSALSRLISALNSPIIRAGIESGAPGPPSWANIGFQVHMFGFLLGVLVAVGLVVARNRRPPTERLLAAAILFGLAQSLWLVVWPGGDDTYVMYQAAGVAFVLALSMLITVAATGGDRRVPRPLSSVSWAPERHHLAIAWLLVLALAVTLGIAGAATAEAPFLPVAIAMVVVAGLLSLPALPPVLPDRIFAGPVTRWQAATLVVVMVTATIGLVGVPYGFIVVDNDTAGGSDSVTVRDYTVAYVDNGTTGHTLAGGILDDELQSEVSGVVIVSDQREIWTLAAREGTLAYRGTVNVSVGGPGWRETVEAERRGWAVVGNDSAYAVDLIVDDNPTRSFTSDPVRAEMRIDGHAVAVVPTDDGFDLRVTRNGSRVGAVPVPAVNGTTQAGPLRFMTEEHGDDVHVVAASDGTRVRIATRN